MSIDRLRKSALFGRVILPAGFYLALFWVMTNSLMARFSTHFFLDAGDGLQNVWNMWWVNEAITELGVHPWHTTYLHHPDGVTLLGHTLNPFNGFVGIALLPFFSLIQAVNAMVVFSFVAGGVTAFWLTWRLTGGSYGGSLLSGFIFSFSNYHFSHAEGHMQLVSLEWIPLFVLSWYALIERPRFSLAVGSGLALFLVILCDYYYFFYCVLTGAMIFFWQWKRAREPNLGFLRKRFVSLAVFLATTLLTSGWILFSLLALNARDPLMGGHSARMFSMDLFAPFIYGGHWRFASLTEFYWSNIPQNIHESSVHIGLSVLFVLILLWLRRGTVRDESPRLWYGILFFFFAMSLGPALRIWGTETSVTYLPYGLLETVFPPLQLSGVPVRMMVMVFLCAGILCGMAFKLYTHQGRKNHLPVILLLLVLFVEYLPGPIPTTRISVPSYVRALAELPGEGGLAVADRVALESMALYHQTIHGRPMAFGYISRVPHSVFVNDNELATLMNERKFEAIYREHDIRYFAIRPRADRGRNPDSDPPIVYEDFEMRIYDLAQGRDVP